MKELAGGAYIPTVLGGMCGVKHLIAHMVNRTMYAPPGLLSSVGSMPKTSFTNWSRSSLVCISHGDSKPT